MGTEGCRVSGVGCRRGAAATACAAAVALIGVLWPGVVRGLNIGEALPSKTVKMKNVDGREIAIADVVGPKGTLVIFSCNACPWVKAWEDRIAALGNGAAKQDIGVIVINSNDPAAVAADAFKPMQQRAREKGFQFPYVVDATSGVARAFGATRTPEAFLFDAQGNLVYHGTIDDNAQQPDAVKEHYLRDAVDAVAAGKKVGTSETKALGCSIKFRQQG